MDVSVSTVSQKIYTIRNVQVILDSDLAKLCGTETRALNQAVRRNPERFPEDFIFQLNKIELETLKASSAMLHHEYHGGRRSLPHAYTQLGVTAVTCVLNTAQSIQLSTSALRAFANFRSASFDQSHLENKINQLVSEQKEHWNKFESRVLALESRIEHQKEKRTNRQEQNQVFRLNPNFSEKVSNIQNIVAQAYGIKVQDLKTGNRTAKVSFPRQVAMYLVRKNTQLGYKEIGAQFGGKDHTTVMHAVRKIENAIEKDPHLHDSITEIQRNLGT